MSEENVMNARKPPEGYELLKSGERVKKGDLQESPVLGWIEVTNWGFKFDPEKHHRMAYLCNVRSISDFFDPYKSEHCRAYAHLCKKGSWPEGFIPKDVELAPGWQAVIMAKMAEAWMKRMISIDDSNHATEKIRADIRARRQDELKAKPKAAEIPGLMKDGWKLFSRRGTFGNYNHVWMTKGDERKDINYNSFASLSRKKIIKVIVAGGMASTTEYGLTEGS